MILTSMVCACLMGATQQKPFIERFDATTLQAGVDLLIAETKDSGHAIMTLFTTSTKDCPITDLAREEMVRSFGLGTNVFMEDYPPNNTNRYLTSVMSGDERKALKELVASTHYEKTLARFDYLRELHDELGNVRKYMAQDLADLPPRVVIVDFPPARNGITIRWYLLFRLTDQKKWRVEYAISEFNIPPA